jgi:L-fuconolactonase
VDVIVEAFGTERIMFGSDWLVCLVAAPYNEVITIVEDYFFSFSKEEKEKVFGGNAIQFYKLQED